MHVVRDTLEEMKRGAPVETPPRYARHLAGGIAGSCYVEIAGAGHISNLERPAEFNAALIEFLASVGDRASAGD